MFCEHGVNTLRQRFQVIGLTRFNFREARLLARRQVSLSWPATSESPIQEQVRNLPWREGRVACEAGELARAFHPECSARKARVSATTRSWNVGSRTSAEPRIGRPPSS
jgi:hypothetical protein